MADISREEQLHKAQEDLSKVVEPLVDSISELVLSTVTGSFSNVQSCCMDIADRTNKLVLIAQQVATSSTDVDMQVEIANSINDIASTIERLVKSFTAVLQSSNPETQHDFAAAAKDVGDSINKLCMSTDQTSQRKVMRAVMEAAQSAKKVQESAKQGKEFLLTAAQDNVEKTVKLVKVVQLASSSTSDERKRAMLMEAANQVKTTSPALIQCSKAVMENPQDVNAQQNLEAKGRELAQAFSQILNASKLSPAYLDKVTQTYEYVKKLLESAKQLEEVVANFYNVVQTGTPQQYLEMAALVSSKAMAMAEQGDNAIRMEKDPVKKQILKDAVQELREASAAMMKASKRYRENPNSNEARAELDENYARLEDAIKAVVSLTGREADEQTPKGKLAMAANALESASNALIRDAQSNPSNVLSDSEAVAAIAMQFARQAEELANQTSDPDQKKRLLQNAHDIQEISQKLYATSKRVAANPNDRDAQKELVELQKQLNDVINQTRKNAQLIPSACDDESSVSTLEFELGKSQEAQLVAAAKEEANAALRLATEAEKNAGNITDPTKKKMLMEAIAQVKIISKKVLEATEKLSKDPHNVQAQQQLSDAQKELSVALQKVVDFSSSPKNDRELSDAMAAMKLETQPDKEAVTSSQILGTAEMVLKNIAETFGNPSKPLSPQEVISHAKELSSKANELSKQLKDMATVTEDPVLKEKLLNCSKIVRDGSIQIKILSAVRAAERASDKSNSVQSASKVLQSNIQDIMKEVRAESLKNRFRSTVKQTIAINKVVSAWKKSEKK